MASAGDKLKILLFGSIANAESEKIFCAKLQALHKSKAGPFDVAFCTGKCSTELLRTSNLPMPVYIHDTITTKNTTEVAASASGNPAPATDAPREDDEEESKQQQVQKLAPNLFVLRSPDNDAGKFGGIWSLLIAPKKPPLVVVSCPWNIRVDDATTSKRLLDQLTHVSYTGCDLLLSHEWPQGVEQCLDANSSSSNTTAPLSSYDVAHVALQARARYHAAPSNSIFQQSTAFEHLAATTNTVATRHVGRFVSLAPVAKQVATTAAEKKRTKFVHAVGIVPLHSMSPLDLEQQRPSTVSPCPFTDAFYETTGSNKNSTAATTAPSTGLSEASARRILQQERQKDSQQQQHRWATKNKRPRPGGSAEDEEEVDPTNTVLFVHGLHQDVSGRLQSAINGDGVLLQYFAPYHVQRIRRPVQHATSSFLFLEFATHQQAADCLEQTGGHVAVDGVHLTLKWRTSSGHKKEHGAAANSSNKRQRLTEAEAKDSSVVYFKLPPTIVADATAAAGESLRKWMERTLEEALAPEDDGDETERVTAETEPALQVKVRMPAATQQQQNSREKEDDHGGKAPNFGFLDFASHAAASMALATLTGSTDGGRLLDDAKGCPTPSLQGLYLHWARPDNKKRDGKDIIEDSSSGFKFERKHFPADARKDCWFCLASEGCEKHLITGVFNSCYAAMPKGPVHKGHVLLIPVKHSSQGALKDPVVAAEMEELKAKLRQHAAVAYDSNLFVFERAIQTKHGYHTHVQCIPIQRDLGIKLQATMVGQARKLGIDLRELNSDLGLQAMLSSDNDDDESGGYFYAELPVTGKEYKRFLYKHNPGSDGRASVPLQFGREVLAASLGKPDLAHWKSCVLEKDEEEAMATAFRESIGNLE